MRKNHGGTKQAKPTPADYAALASDVPDVQRRRAVSVVVESPYGHGVDRVSMVDPINAMIRQGRLSKAEIAAADRYRRAFDAVYAGGCSALALDVIDGRSSNAVSDRRLRGAADLRDANRLLGALEPHLRSVIAGAATLEQVGRSIGETDKRRAKVAGSTLVKFSVARLADAWASTGLGVVE